MWRYIACLSMAAALLHSHSSVDASVHTVDFTSGSGQGVINRVGSPGGTGINRYTEEAMTFATGALTQNHNEFFGTPGATSWGANPIGTFPWHRGGSNPQDPNVITATLSGGAAFDLLSLSVVQNPLGITFTSSTGSIFAFPALSTGVINFNAMGDDWENITSFAMLIGPGTASAIHAIDNVVFDDVPTVQGVVPEPVSIFVWGGLACASAVVGFRRRARC